MAVEALQHVNIRCADVECPPRGGAVDHVVFGATGVDATTAALRAAGIAFTARPADGMTQVFVHDPDGVKVELNFYSPSR